ncbi:MAG: GNAT family N-acetyltransferase [Verrucomicrobiota bacterium]
MKFKEYSVGDDLYRDSLRLREECLRIPLGLKLSESDKARDSEQFHFCLLDELEMIASISVDPLNRFCVQFRQMAVKTTRQGRGVGALLLTLVEKEMVERGYQRIVMDARVMAEAFYDKQGYQAEGERFSRVGIDHIRMSKKI